MIGFLGIEILYSVAEENVEPKTAYVKYPNAPLRRKSLIPPPPKDPMEEASRRRAEEVYQPGGARGAKKKFGPRTPVMVQISIDLLDRLDRMRGGVNRTEFIVASITEALDRAPKPPDMVALAALRRAEAEERRKNPKPSVKVKKY